MADGSFYVWGGAGSWCPGIKFMRYYDRALTEEEIQHNIEVSSGNTGGDNETWSKTKDVTVKISDQVAGLATGAQLQYGWSTSTTTAPTKWNTVQVTGYTEGAKSATFTATASPDTIGETYAAGKYYLWVKPVTLKDTAYNGGNSQTNTSKSTKLYWIDNKPPTITINPNTSATIAKSHTVTVTLGDQHSGLASGTSVKYGWSTSTSTAPSYTTTTSTTFTTTTPSATGEYYLWVVPTTLKDLSVEGGNSNTTTAKSGVFKVDLTPPTAGTMTFKNADGTTYTPGDNNWTKQNVTLTLANGTDTAGTVNSGHKTTTYTIDGTASTATSITTEGKHTIVITTTDNAGNTSTRTYKVNIDKTAPTAGTMTFKNADGTTYTPGDDNWTKQNVTLTLANGTDTTGTVNSGHKTTTYTIDGTASTATSITTEGKHTIVITTTDNAGNTATRTYKVNIDKTPPTAPTTMEYVFGNWDRYTQGTWTNKSVYAANTNSNPGPSGATDALSGVAKYQISSDNSTWVDYSYNGSNSMYGFTTQGIHVRYFRAVDKVGNASTSINRTAQIDLTLPTLTVSPSSADWRNSALNITITHNDTGGSGISSTSGQYFLTTSSSPTATGTLSNYTSGTAFSINPAEGQYYLFVKQITDKASNISNTTDQVTISGVKYHRYGLYKFDKTIPTLTVSPSSADWRNSALNITITHNDTGGSGISSTSGQYFLTTSSSPTSTGTLSNYTSGTAFSINPAEGQYYLFVKQITDKASNISNTTDQVTISGVKYHRYGLYKFDKTIPTLTVNPSSADWRNSALNITITHNDTGGSGISSTSGQYFLTTSSSPTSTGTLSNYTSGTAFSINPSEGQYYLFVKQISDNATNKSSTTNYVTISGVTYHRYGLYKFDKTIPTLTVNPSSADWRNSALNITITHNDTGGSGIASTSGQYFLTTSSSPTATGTLSNYTSGTAFSINPAEGQYYLFVKQITDNATNISNTTDQVTISGVKYHRYGLYKFDKTIPTLTVSPSSADWRNSALNITITHNDTGGSGISSTSGQYFLTTSSSPTATGTLSNYTSGTAFSINPAEGQYYLFVKQITDKATNISNTTDQVTISGVKYHRYGLYKFDKTIPTLTVSPSSADWRNSALSVTVTHNDTGGSGVSSTSGQYFLTTSSSPTTVPTGSSVSGTYTSGTAFNINPGTTGQYYLFVKQITDKATNISNTTDQVTIGGVKYHRYGVYKFDYTKPIWSYVSKDIYYSTANDAGNDNYANRERTVKITFKGTDANSGVKESTLTSDNITVSVNGTAVANSNKSLTKNYDATAKEVTCTLTITNITGDGTLNVVLPSGSLKDFASNTNDQKTLTTDVNITIDNTSPTLSFNVTSPTAGYYKAGQVITITATYNENVYKEITSNNLIDTTAEAPAMQLTFGGANAKGTVSCSSVSGKVITYTYTIQGATNTEGTNGDNGALVVKSLGTVYDAAGNAISASNVTPSVSIVADTIAPTLTITANKTSPTNASSITYTFTFSEGVTGFTADDVTVTNGTKGTFTATSSSVYTLVVTNSGSCTQTVNVSADKCVDRAGNGNKAATPLSILIDRDIPTLTVSPTSSDWRNSALSVTITAGDTGGSGLSSSNLYQYFLTTSDSPTSTGTLSNYTSGTAFNINPGTSGQYYLYVRQISDNATNISNTANQVTIGGVKYHRYGLYKFDYEQPIATGITLSKIYTNTGKITATANGVEDIGGSGVKAVYWYVDNSSGTRFLHGEASDGQWYKEIDISAQPEGWYKVGIAIQDNATNWTDTTLSSRIGWIDFCYDKTAPTAPTTMEYVFGNWDRYTQGTWTNKTVYAAYEQGGPDTYKPRGAEDTLSGVEKYQISTDNSTWVDYSYDGTNSMYGFSTQGTHIRYFRAVDKAGNAGPSINRTAQIDLTLPTLTVSPTSSDWKNSAVSVTVTHNDTGGSGVASDSGSYFLSTSESPTAVPTGSTVSGTYTSGTAFDINPGTSGQYYLYVRQITDNATNGSSTTDYVTIDGVTYHRYGLYKFDYDQPIATGITLSTIYTNTGIITATANGVEDIGGSGVKIVKWYVINSSGTRILNGVASDGQWYKEIDISAQPEGWYKVGIVLDDNAGNYNDTTYANKIGLIDFCYDKTAPTLTVSPTSSDWKNSAVSVTITAEDTGSSGLSSSNLYEYFLSTSASPTAVPTGSTVSGTYTSGTAFDINPGTSGEYYLYVRQISDNATNISNTANQVTIGGVTYHRYGLYKFDYDQPIATGITLSTVYTNTGIITATANGLEDIGGSGVNRVRRIVRPASSWSWIVDTANDTFDISAQPEGWYKVALIIHDNAGNMNDVADSATSTSYIGWKDFCYDTTAPIWTTENINIDKTNKKVTVDLVGTDSLAGYASNSLDINDITVKVDGETASSVTKELSAVTYYKADGTVTTNESEAVKVKYTLTLSTWEQSTLQAGKIFKEWSGAVSIDVAAGALTDKAGNTNVADSYSLGHADFIKPEIKLVSANNGTTTQTIVFNVIDKYLDTTDANAAVKEDEIIVYIDGVEVSGITKTIKSKTNLTATVNGDSTHIVGQQYTLELSNFTQDDWSGTISILVKADAVEDTADNKNIATTLFGKHIDEVKPVIEKVSSTKDPSAKTETIVFNVLDKYLDTTDALTAGEIKVYVDNVEVTSQITKTLTKVQDFTETVNGDPTHIVGQQYQVVLSGFEKTRSIAYNQYTEYSGTVRIEIVAGAVKDIAKDGSGGNTNDLTPVAGDFVDFIKPDVNYIYATSDINRNYKYFTMQFELVDKYFANSTLTNETLTQKLTILIDGEDVTTNPNVTKEIISVTDVTTTGAINKTVSGTVQSVTNAVIGKRYTLKLSNLEQNPNDGSNYSGVVSVAIKSDTVTDTSENGNLVDTTTIKTGNLPSGGLPSDGTVDVVDPVWVQAEDPVVKTSLQTATVTIKSFDKFYNSTSFDENNITVLVNGAEATSGITVQVVEDTSVTLEEGEQYKVTITGFPQTAYSLKIVINEDTITDKSGNTSKEQEFVLYTTLMEPVGGREGTSLFLDNPYGIQRQYVEQIIFMETVEGTATTRWDVSALQDETIMAWYETRTVSGKTLYTVYIGSHVIMNANRDSSYLFSYIGYDSSCKVTGDTEDNPLIKNLEYLRMDNVTLMGDMFYYTGYSNMKSLDLGSNFNTENVEYMSGMFNNCGATAMTSLDLGDKFDTSNVRWMSNMFKRCGSRAMTSLDLGDKFDTGRVQGMNAMFEETGYYSMTSLDLGTKFNTSGVTDMGNMFYMCGYTAMTSLDLSSGTNATNTTQFNTSSVTNMKNMFLYCGYTAMTSLNLGNNFDTSKVGTDTNYVESMTSMFSNCGSTAMTSLDLGDKFNTSNVTNMRNMFNGCGYTAMTSLDLGDKFDTSKVTDMNYMFNNCGLRQLTSLDLGDKFYTTNVYYMEYMFYNCGYNQMTSLDLGPAFTKIASTNTNFIVTAGKSGCVIYAPESIYKDMTNFKLSTDSTTTITYDRGTINPIYRPEWEKVSSTLTADGTMTIEVKGSANKEFNIGNTLTDPQNYLSNVTSSSNAFTVYVDGEVASDVTASISMGTPTLNESTGTTEITATITLKDFAKTLRKTGKNFLEWTGNVSVQLARGTLVDIYGNKNLAEIGIDTSGGMDRVEIEDALTDREASGIMFVDDIKPEFTYEYSSTSTVIDHGTETVTVVFDVTDKYFNGVDTDKFKEENIDIIVDSTQIPSSVTLGKTLTKLQDLTYTTGNGTVLTVGARYQLVITGLDRGDGEKYSGPMTLSFLAGCITDKSGNVSDAKTITLGINEPDQSGSAIIVDVVDPIWKAENININHTNKDVTVDLVAYDKYYASNSLDTGDITVNIDGVDLTTAITDVNVKKALSIPDEYQQVEYIESTGTQYIDTGVIAKNNLKAVAEFSVTKLDTVHSILGARHDTNTRCYLIDVSADNTFEYGFSTDYFNFGEVEINQKYNVDVTLNNGKQTFMVDAETINETNLSGEFVSELTLYLFARNEMGWTNNKAYSKVYSCKIYDNDTLIRYFIPCYRKSDNVIGMYDLVENKFYTNDGTGEFAKGADVDTQTTGVRYTLTLSNWQEAARQSGKNYLEWSGTTKITIAGGTITDQYTNTSNEQEFTLGHVDFIKPEIVEIEPTTEIQAQDAANKTETIVFTVTDKYLNTTDMVTKDEITIYVDGEDATSALKDDAQLTYEAIDGGYKYTLVIKNLEKVRNAKEYKDWSGTVSIKIAEGAAKDTNTPTANVNDETTIVGDFVDYINPNLKYTHQSTDINTGNKTYTMTFDITDKYYTSGVFSTADITNGNIEILMQNGQKDASGNPIVYNLKDELPSESITLTATAKYASNVPITNASTGAVETITSHQIGHTYTLTISNLEQLERKVGLTTADYSGIVTVAIPANRIVDRTGNKNPATTITSGVNIPGGTGNGVAVDVVDPIWERVSSSANAIDQTATIKILGTDTYFNPDNTDASTLTSDEIELYINGVKNTSITPTISTATAKTESRTQNGVTSTVQYGVEYTITVTGFAQNVNQVKIRILEDAITDKSGNGNKATEIIAYNCLELESSGTDAETGEARFLDASNETGIARKDIEKVVFVSSIDGATASGVTKVWDVSAQNDGSIKAWTSQTSAPYTVYIGSDFEIFGNRNSKHLFAGVASGSNCTATEAISGLNLLNTSSVTSMYSMFYSFGSKAMTSLDLGDKFDTSNVNMMQAMFLWCGGNSMISLDLGDKFDTSNVTNMAYMFQECGAKAMTSLDLSSGTPATNTTQFNTSNVKNMYNMFATCGKDLMRSLNLGNNFDTSKVTNMSKMFKKCGYTAMTSLNLGTKFNTSSVTDMSYMFNECGYTAMTSLNLGHNFNTGNVTKMENMFYACGYTAMTSLDLSSGTNATNTIQFNTSSVTNMGGMFSYCGYTAMTSLNLGNNFDTSSVESASNMFQYCGYTAMTSLDLKDKFDTSSLTLMSGMFQYCGYTAMTKLDLGDKFDTSSAKYVAWMFAECGYTAMTSLDLGDKFYVNQVINMYAMFRNCGHTAMTTLDLGPHFTKIPTGTFVNGETTNNVNDSFIIAAGKSGCVIYAPESIYKNKNAFKLNSTDATETPSGLAYTTGTINPIYRPEWTHSSTLDTTNKELEITLKGSAYKTNTSEGIDATTGITINYASNVTSTLDISDIQVFINGVDVTSLTNPAKVLSTASYSTNATSGKTEVTHTLTLSNFEEAVRQTDASGKVLKFDEWSGNVSIKIKGRGQATSTYTENVLTDTYGNQYMMATDETGTWIDIEFKDGEIVENTNGSMFTDFIKPEFTYEYSETTIGDGNHGDTKILTVVFYAADKYFDATNSSLALSDLTFIVDGQTVNINVAGNSLTPEALADGTGTKYTLVVKNLEQNPNDGFSYSGTVSITIPPNKFVDYSENKNDAKTIIIGKDDPTTGDGHDSAVIVDVVDPIWKVKDGTLSVTTVSGKTTATMTLVATDKYFKESTLTKDQIEILVDGVDISDIAPDAEITLSDPTTVENGVEYTFTVANLEETDATFFAERAKYAVNTSTGRVFREFSGPTQILVPENTAEDLYGNLSEELIVDLGTIDTLKPEVIKVSSQAVKDATNVENSKHIIVFDIVDKYFVSSAISTTDTSKIHVLLDGEEATTVTKTITNIEELRATVGTNTNQLVGYRYTLELSNFENPRTSVNFNREFTDWSGDLSIKIDANTAKDASGTWNAETILTGNENTTTPDFVDYVKPDVTYQYTDSTQAVAGDINYSDKTFTMVFDITDKHFTNSTLAIGDLEILIDGEEPDWTKVSKSLAITDRKNTVNSVADTVIGKRYTLTLSHLEQLQILSGDKYLDYSGVVTVAIPAGKATDSEGNSNDATTITSGIDIPGGVAGDSQIVDVVDPLWEKVSTSANAINQTTTITVRGTDKYFDADDTDASTLTADEIEVYVNGAEASITPTVTLKEELEEQRVVGGVSSTVQYGVEYTITITGFAQNVNQVKIKILEDAITDQSGNGNKAIEIIAYNCLELTDSETDATDGFLDGNGTNATGIARQDIEKVVFVSSIDGATASGVAKVWDVSAQNDGSIKAWTSQTSAPYTVYIGSNYEIFANQNSAALFNYIGYSEACTATETISGLNLLNTSSVKYMGWMFRLCGYKAMTTLDLGDKFDTSNVTDMGSMFASCGYKAMTTLDLGDKFDTSNVTTMNSMFANTGYTAMTSLNLSFGTDSTNITQFNTSSVTNMNSMFYRCGNTAMTSLNLGHNFNTGNVLNMSQMFYSCGYTAMTSLNLGTKFDTSNVTDMSSMFNRCGFTAMTSLDLSSGTNATNTTQFNTSSVTNMDSMFIYCGYTAMQTIKLGNNFDTGSVTNMHNMFADCGSEVMTSLSLGDKFDTSNVTDMSGMFWNTGKNSMTSLNLGEEFDTSQVTNMRNMFRMCGYGLTSLDLGDKFNTSNVTDMYGMFSYCGYGSLSTLDLGPAFTNIPKGTVSVTDSEGNTTQESAHKDMFLNCGTSSLKIYAPEAIYSDMTSFK